MTIRGRMAARASTAVSPVTDPLVAALPAQSRGAKGVGDRERQMAPSAQGVTLKQSAALTELEPDPAPFDSQTVTMALMPPPPRRGMKLRIASEARVQHGSASRGSDTFAMAIACNTRTSERELW